MTICVYCGLDCHRPPSLRMHLKRAKHARNNISVVRETMGKGSSTIPSWTVIPRRENISHGRSTRSRTTTNRADTIAQLCREQSELRILQYNIQKSRDVVLASLFQDQWIATYDVLASQEPWRNPFVTTSYHPLKTHFRLLYMNDKETRVCFYINKRIDASTWNVLSTYAMR